MKSFLKKNEKDLDCTNSWRGMVRRGQLSASMVVEERELCVTGGAG